MSCEYPQSRGELLARVAAGRAELDAFIAGLSAALIDAPYPGGDWSVKDHLYHLGAWERKVLAQMHGESIPAALGIDQETWDSDEINAINAAIYAQGRDLPTTEALASFHAAHETLLAALEVYPEADYGKPGYPVADVIDPDGTESGPMVAYIAGNTYEHYAEHLDYIKRLV